jgi:arylsulfatase A-like enzyme
MTHLLFSLAFLAIFTCSPLSGADRPMNVVLILADDLGWSDCTLYGTTRFYHTPNLDRLARRGMTFTRAYSDSPLCSPTRASLLTGLAVARHGISAPTGHTPEVILEPRVAASARPGIKTLSPQSVSRLQTSYHTVAKAFKQSGYATGHFGKWHLGAPPYSALEHGFDVDLPHDSGPGPRRGFVGIWNYPELKPRSPEEHIEDRMVEEAVKFIETSKTQPFFLNYWQFSVHAPFDAKKGLVEKYRKLADPENPQRSPTYASMVETMDHAVGELLDALDRYKLSDNTVVIFLSDNGGNMYDTIDQTTPTSNAPLRGGKATLWEGGVRVPCIVAWPDVTRPGSRTDALLAASDFYPTFADLLSIKIQPGQSFDGFSIAQVLKGGKNEREAVFIYFPHSPGSVPDRLPPGIAVIQDDWKLIRLFHDGEDRGHRHLLYHLKEDIGEKHDLASREPGRVGEMAGLIDAHLASTRAVLPKPNPDYQVGGPLKNPWTGGPLTNISLEEGRLVMEAKSNDPWISINLPVRPKSSGPYQLDIRMKSSGGGPGQILWKETPEQPYNGRERAAGFRPVHDGAYHDSTVSLPAGALAGIRLDPGTGKGEYVLEHLRLRAGNRSLFAWPSRKAPPPSR